MKKLIAFFIVAILLVSIKYFKIDDFSLFQTFDQLVIVTDKFYTNLNLESQNGEQYYYTFENNDKDKIMIESIDKNDIEAYVFYYQPDKKLKDFSVYFDYIYQGGAVENYDVYYGYYAGYNDFCNLKGKKVNFQLVHSDNCWILGFPLIVTGYWLIKIKN